MKGSILDAGILGTMIFRLLFRTQDDRYERESARYVIDAISVLDDESAAVTIKLVVMSVAVDLN